MIIKHLW